MREFTKSLFSYSLAVSLFGLKQMENILTPKDRDQEKAPATKAFDAVTNATVDQFGETLSSTFRMLDNTQRGVVSMMFSFLGVWPTTERQPDSAEPRRVTEITWSSEPVRDGRSSFSQFEVQTGTY